MINILHLTNIEMESSMRAVTMGQDTKLKIVSWSQDRVMDLIDHWRAYECLYNPSNTLYSNKNARQNALEAITHQMRATMPQLTISDVKTKMNYLRSQYCREMHKYSSDEKYTAAHDENYKCYPYWFESLSFVQKFVRVRGSKRERSDINQMHLTSSSNDEISRDKMPTPIKRSKSNDMSPTSTNHSAETATYLYNPDPDILELFQRQLASLTSTHPVTDAKSQQPTTNQQTNSNSNPRTIGIASTHSEYEQTFMSFIKVNLAVITDLALKDELLDKITMLLLEYKEKQRTLDKC